jgi:anti-anti-sigma factor
MPVTIKNSTIVNNTMILEVTGYINAINIANFKKHLQILCHNNYNITIDCKLLKGINSNGLVVLSNVIYQNKNVKITMNNTATEIIKLLDLCGITKIIEVL